MGTETIAEPRREHGERSFDFGMLVFVFSTGVIVVEDVSKVAEGDAC
jgi:hypothetical protein